MNTDVVVNKVIIAQMLLMLTVTVALMLLLKNRQKIWKSETPFNFDNTALIYSVLLKKKRQYFGRNVVQRKCGYWYEVVPRYSDREFQENFRIPRSLFQLIVRTIENDAAFIVAGNKRHIAFGVDLQLAITLARLGRGETLKGIASRFDVSQSTVDKATWRITEVILKYFRGPNIEGKFPKTPEQKSMISGFFARKKGCNIPGVIGLIDGVHVPIDSAPKGSNSNSYHNFKSFYSISFVHIVNHKKQHVYITGGFAGNSHDSGIIALSKLPIMAEEFGSDYHLLGDSGIAGQIWCITRGRENRYKEQWERDFDMRISSGRAGVEMAFGITKARFRFARGKQGVKFEEGKRYNGEIISAVRKYEEAWLTACILHNMCIDWNLENTAAFDEDLQREADAEYRNECEMRAERPMGDREFAILNNRGEYMQKRYNLHHAALNNAQTYRR